MIKKIIDNLKFWEKKQKPINQNKKVKKKKKLTLFNCKASQVDYLVNEKGADVNQTNKYGKTPLFYTKDKMKTIKLIANGANIYHQDPNTRSFPVFDAPTSLIPLYLKAGFDPNLISYSEHIGWYNIKLLEHVVDRISSYDCKDYFPGGDFERILLDLVERSNPQVLENSHGGSFLYLHSSTINKILTHYKNRGVSLSEIIIDQGNTLPECYEGNFLEIYLVDIDSKVRAYNCCETDILEYDKKNFVMLHNEGFSLKGVLNVTLRDSRYIWFTDYVADNYKKMDHISNRDECHVFYALATADTVNFKYFMDNHFHDVFSDSSTDDNNEISYHYRDLFKWICSYSCFSKSANWEDITREKIKILLALFNGLLDMEWELLKNCSGRDYIIKYLIDLDININIADEDGALFIDSISEDCKNYYKAHLAKKEKALIAEFITPEDIQPRKKRRL